MCRDGSKQISGQISPSDRLPCLDGSNLEAESVAKAGQMGQVFVGSSRYRSWSRPALRMWTRSLRPAISRWAAAMPPTEFDTIGEAGDRPILLGFSHMTAAGFDESEVDSRTRISIINGNPQPNLPTPLRPVLDSWFWPLRLEWKCASRKRYSAAEALSPVHEPWAWSQSKQIRMSISMDRR